MIDKKKLVSKHNPRLFEVKKDSPLTVGNGEFAFTADVTGMQSLYQEYVAAHMPLCTMSQWGWHTTPGSKAFTLADVEHTAYDYEDRKIHLPVEKKPGSEEAYQWLRENPHRPNLARFGLTYNGEEINPESLENIKQELRLYDGHLNSSFAIDGHAAKVVTVCDSESDILGFKLSADPELFKVKLCFPYGSHNMSGSDWDSPQKHETAIINQEPQSVLLKRQMDDADFYVAIQSESPFELRQTGPHEYEMSSIAEWEFTVNFSQQAPQLQHSYEKVSENSEKWWSNYWETTGLIDFEGSADPRAQELERRLILSQYLLAIQSAGSLPPQETGLTCNSWHGKFHLEMHPWHSAWMPLYNQSNLLKRSLPWYEEILDKAKGNAAKNGFVGAKWPKQVAYDGMDSPSLIATVLIWQQSHLIFMLDLIEQAGGGMGIIEGYWETIAQTADFMCDYLTYNPEKEVYELGAPIIPAQEEHDPRNVKNPTFEVEYWRYCLGLAIKWAEKLGKPHSWQGYYEKITPSPVGGGCYLAHENCPTTFEDFNRDHPSMLGAWGYIPNDRMDEGIMRETLNKVLEVWDFESMWGWDFALMAMTATRLGLPDLAMDILMMDTPKNDYVASGNNFQRLRTDLPLYLPGNGSLLLAAAYMVAGFEGSGNLPGIPKQGWKVRYENLLKSRGN
ncbi:MAG: hypothetical protein FWF59_15355 [Turicibacter sp.]|nr:hypothetical protein [Turicibacter sp.]